MKDIHYRPWEQSSVGGALNIPPPQSKGMVRTRSKKSLNIDARRHESMRIANENAKLWQQLVATKGSVNNRDLIKDYKQHEKHKK